MRIQSTIVRSAGILSVAVGLFCSGCKKEEKSVQAAPASSGQLSAETSRQVENLARESGYEAASGENSADVAQRAAQQAADKVIQQRAEVEKAAE